MTLLRMWKEGVGKCETPCIQRVVRPDAAYRFIDSYKIRTRGPCVNATQLSIFENTLRKTRIYTYVTFTRDTPSSR